MVFCYWRPARCVLTGSTTGTSYNNISCQSANQLQPADWWYGKGILSLVTEGSVAVSVEWLPWGQKICITPLIKINGS